MVTICMGGFRREVLVRSMEPPTGRVLERSKGDTACPASSQNPSHWRPSWLSDVCTTRKCCELERLAKDHPETNPITSPRLRSGSPGFPCPPALRPGPFPDKSSCFVSTCVSPDNSFLSVSQEHAFGPWKGSAVLQQNVGVELEESIQADSQTSFLFAMSC